MPAMEEHFVGYVLNLLDEDVHQEVAAYLRAHPEEQDRLARLRTSLEPLQVDRPSPDPPRHLVANTLALLAENGRRLLPAAPQVRGNPVGGRSWWRRSDVVAASILALVVSGLVVAWLARGWFTNDVTACKENLHKYHRALVQYSETHDERAFPQVQREGPQSVAGVFIPVLADAGLLSADISLTCPANGTRPPPLQPNQVQELASLHQRGDGQFALRVKNLSPCYAYSLGWWEGNNLRGLRARENADLLPILADRPSVQSRFSGQVDNSPNHGGKGQCVLTVGGSVRFYSSRTVGMGGDDIYVNRNRHILAGVQPHDTVLGSSYVTPVME